MFCSSVVRARKSTVKFKEEIERLKGEISHMKLDAITDYEYMMMQSDELAKLRTKIKKEQGKNRASDQALDGLMAQMAGLQVTFPFYKITPDRLTAETSPSPLQGLTKVQEAELRRMQAITESLQARAERPRTPHVTLNLAIQGSDQPLVGSPAGGRSLRDDPGCNMLFEQLVLDMGYDAEAARQAIVALPGGLMDEIIDYIIDKEAIFESWRRFKASVAVESKRGAVVAAATRAQGSPQAAT